MLHKSILVLPTLFIFRTVLFIRYKHITSLRYLQNVRKIYSKSIIIAFRKVKKKFLSYYFLVIGIFTIFVFKREMLWLRIIYGKMNTGFC